MECGRTLAPVTEGGGEPLNTPEACLAASLMGSRITRLYDSVCLGDIGSPWDDGVLVELYPFAGGVGARKGQVFYGHADNMPANGVYNTVNDPDSGLRYVAQVAKIAENDCGCGCYVGRHVHCERGSVNGTSSHNPYIYCSTSVYKGATWIYKYTA